jgi:hypothetical protein
MNLSLKDLEKDFIIARPASSEELAKIDRHFGYPFPADYKDFLMLTNGLEGGKDNYLVLWRTSDLIELNVAYQVKDFVQNTILFGSDGAEDAFAFDISNPKPIIVRLPFIGMGHTPAEKLADTFGEFLASGIQQRSLLKRLFG